MAKVSHLGSNTTIILAGLLLSSYLLLLIGLVYGGQQRLVDSFREQDQLAMEKQAAAIAFFLSEQKDTLQEFSNNQFLKAFLANRNLGMSMQYGLRASLLALTRELERLAERKTYLGKPVFERIAFIESDGNILTHAGTLPDDHPFRTHPPPNSGAPVEFEIVSSQGRPILYISSVVEYKGSVAGVTLAEIALADVAQPLLKQTKNDHHSQVVLKGPDGEVLYSTNNVTRGGSGGYDGTEPEVLQASIADTRLSLYHYSFLGHGEGLLTSRWFLAGIASLTIPVLLGVLFLLKLNYRHLLLQARLGAAQQQRQTLHQHNLRLIEEIDRRQESERKLEFQANYDQLTGLPNRNLAMDRLAQEIKHAKRGDRSVFVYFVDLDRFKQVNDSLGHAAGDELLSEAARRLTQSTRETDTVARLGGDEFLVICPKKKSAPRSDIVAAGLINAMAPPFYITEHEFFVGASIGVSCFPDDGDDAQKLMRKADLAMYAAKEEGRNRFCLYKPAMDDLNLEIIRLENLLRHAGERGELRLLYQPIVALADSSIVGVEALLRWESPELGSVMPDRFIPVAEETAIIHDIGAWVVENAVPEVTRIASRIPLRLAVNISPQQFKRPERLFHCVKDALSKNPLAPERLELEITERVLLDDRLEAENLLRRLTDLGTRLSIDDFGTGYSALGYLQRFSFDVLKIDRSFTQGIGISETSESLIRTIIAMGHALGLDIIAEGIETKEQEAFLKKLNCNLGQGFFYSRPVEISEISRLVQSDPPWRAVS